MPEMSRDETARVSVSRHIDLEMADLFRGGWKALVVDELDRMRAEMPYADSVELRLACERRPEAREPR